VKRTTLHCVEPVTVRIEKLVHGGQGLGTLSDGRKVFVWNALPGETVQVHIIKAKKSYAEGIAEAVLESSKGRIEPVEANYLATSPWQMMTFEAENRHKREIVAELFEHEKIALPVFNAGGQAVHIGQQWNYRNKMEYSFWGDDEGLHLALHQRGSHGKQIVQGSKLALPAVDTAANAICAGLGGLGVRAGELKTVIVRASQDGTASASLFVKNQDFLDTYGNISQFFTDVSQAGPLQGLRVYFSDPKSPASVPTSLLQEWGNGLLQDSLLGTSFAYDADSFFQVNLPIFEKALGVIKSHVSGDSLTDMYSGVGSIGLSVATRDVTLVELDPACVRMASQNAAANETEQGLHNVTIVEASTEKVLEYITADTPVIFDPPRAGLHDKVTARVLDKKPPQVIYLSCNPATHARDIARLQSAYTVEHFEVFNFFPRTPHIETLAVLRRN
jgi:23S rRNA (uracil1939-C5)-methyltransferase